MEYLLIISHDANFHPTERLFEEIGDWIKDAESRGIRKTGKPLQAPGEAQTVRIRNSETMITPGPFSPAEEQMCAFELIECATKEEAVEIAASHPMAKVATIEVRPVWHFLEIEVPRPATAYSG
jgi:hypothetical protein